jgi:uncharacterized protein YjbI with pentapeptide repeats
VPKPPRIDPLRLDDLADGDPDDLSPRADLEATAYADLALPALALRDARLDAVRLSQVAADEADLRGVRLSEVDLDQVSLPVVRAARGDWRDVRVSGRLGSVEAYETQWRGVRFVGCKLSYLNLRGAELLDVGFTDCVIDELDLMGATATRIAFTGCRVTHLSVQDATLTDVDLRGADLEVVDGLAGLRGATVSDDQLTRLAPLLAAHLGIMVDG